MNVNSYEDGYAPRGCWFQVIPDRSVKTVVLSCVGVLLVMKTILYCNALLSTLSHFQLDGINWYFICTNKNNWTKTLITFFVLFLTTLLLRLFCDVMYDNIYTYSAKFLELELLVVILFYLVLKKSVYQSKVEGAVSSMSRTHQRKEGLIYLRFISPF